MQHQPGRIRAGLDRGQDLAAAGDVEVQALLVHHPLNGGAWERLRREGQIAARPAAAERGEVVTGPLAQGVFGNDDRRGSELCGDVVEPAAADHQGAVVVLPGPGREEAEQVRGRWRGIDRHRLSVTSATIRRSRAVVRRVRDTAIERVRDAITHLLPPDTPARKAEHVVSELTAFAVALSDGVFFAGHLEPDATDIERMYRRLWQAVTALIPILLEERQA